MRLFACAAPVEQPGDTFLDGYSLSQDLLPRFRPYHICFMSQLLQLAGQSSSSCVLPQKLKDAIPLTQPMRYVGIENVRRYYENVQLPDRLFVLGDSVAAFNPVRAHD